MNTTTKKRGRPKKQETVHNETEEQLDSATDYGEIMNLKVIRQLPNPRWVGCNLDGNLIKVAISPKYTNKLVGKTIKVAKVQRDLLESYEHIP